MGRFKISNSLKNAWYNNRYITIIAALVFGVPMMVASKKQK
jgi:hypothetical protein